MKILVAIAMSDDQPLCSENMNFKNGTYAPKL